MNMLFAEIPQLLLLDMTQEDKLKLKAIENHFAPSLSEFLDIYQSTTDENKRELRKNDYLSVVRLRNAKREEIYNQAKERELEYFSSHLDELFDKIKSYVEEDIIAIQQGQKTVDKWLVELYKEEKDEAKKYILTSGLVHHIIILWEKAPERYEEIVKLIQDIFKREQLQKDKTVIKVRPQRAKTIKDETTKVGNLIMKRPDNDKFYDEGEIKVWTSETRQSKVVVYVSLTIEDLKRQGMNIPAIDRLTPFDREVLCAVISLYEVGNEYMTTEMIYRIMSGNKNGHMSPQMRDEIFASLTKLRFTRITIDATQEFEAGRNTKDKYDGVLLNTEVVTREIVLLKGKEVKNCIRVFRNSPLYDYADGKNQIRRIDTTMLDVPIDNTREMIVLKGFLARRVTDFKNTKNKLRNVILYESIYELLQKQNASREKKRRIRDKVKIILNDWKKKGIIKEFEELDEDNKPPKSTVPIKKIRIIV